MTAAPTLRTYRPGDETAILALFADSFGQRQSLERWRWQFEQAPEAKAIIHLLVDDGAIVGHLAHLPFALWMDGERRRLAQGCDLMVRTDYRGRGATRRLVEGFLASDHGCDARMNFPNRLSSHLMQRYGGGRFLGRLPKWVRTLGGDPSLGPVGNLVARVGALHGRLVTPRRRVAALPTVDRPDEAFDALARESSSFARCIRLRDSAYLTWRWRRRPEAAWTITAVRDDRGRLAGFAVLGPDADPASRRGRIVDLLAREPGTLRTLLLDAVDRLAAEGCRRVVCELQDPRPWARRQLLRAGFLPFRGDLPVLARPLSPRAGTLPSRLDHWYLTRGDTDLA